MFGICYKNRRGAGKHTGGLQLSVSAEIIMTPGDLKVYNEMTECWICKGFFIKPVLEIVQKIEKAKHNLLEIKEWESCIEKEHFKKKEVQKRY
uniref:Uncharacterized protein n=1 Tax=Rhizophagus irregularis (strain DAOM 181602 / DAOM 197198 / MUCL 43194) TaxID=747089 RepID=U9UPG3_RHIID